LTDNGVVGKDFIELSQLKEEDFVEILALYVPELLHSRCKGFEFLFTYE
jgi:hypothetical protein